MNIQINIRISLNIGWFVWFAKMKSYLAKKSERDRNLEIFEERHDTEYSLIGDRDVCML
jgi:hypothetical protein